MIYSALVPHESDESDTAPSTSNQNKEIPDNDFGIIVERGREGVSAEEKRHFLQNAFVPPENYDLPYEEHQNAARNRTEKRYLKHSDLRDQRARWISFSPKSGGLFCRACFFFSTVRNSSFVDKPFSRWRNIWSTGKGIGSHIEKAYHIDAVEKALSFLDPAMHISSNFSEDAKRKQEIGRKTLRTNIEAAIFLAKLGLPFRGHADYGPMPVIANIEGFVGDQGNFRAMLQFGAMKSVDENKTMIEACKIENQSSKKEQYYSAMIQNEIIECIGDVVLENVLRRLKKVGFYSVIADEATDVASVHQMSIVLRYVDIDSDFEVREDFVGFIELNAGTGLSLANYILRYLEQCDLGSSVMVGQGYDGAAAMSGCNIGCQVHVRQVHKAAIYVHCSAHNLNLAVAKSSTIPEVVLAMNIISEVHDFFKNHHYVQQFLATAIRGILDTGRKRTVRAVCDTRWVDSHTACIDFCTLFECIATGLADCYLHCEQVAAQAKSLELLKKIADPGFIFSVVLLARCNAVLRCLSKELQKEDTDLLLACDEVLTAQDRFRSWLGDTLSEESGTFQAVAKEAAIHARTAIENLHRALKMPLLEPEAPEFDCMKERVYNRFLQSLIERLDLQFGAHFTLAASISNLLPHRVTTVSFRDIEHVVDFYAEAGAVTSRKDYVKDQFDHWKAKCSRMPVTLCGVRETIRRCRPESTPDIHKLLLIYATIPVSSGL